MSPSLGDPRGGALGHCLLPKGLGQTTPLSLPGAPELLLSTSWGLFQSCQLEWCEMAVGHLPDYVLESPQLSGPPWAGGLGS